MQNLHISFARTAKKKFHYWLFQLLFVFHCFKISKPYHQFIKALISFELFFEKTIKRVLNRFPAYMWVVWGVSIENLSSQQLIASTTRERLLVVIQDFFICALLPWKRWLLVDETNSVGLLFNETATNGRYTSYVVYKFNDGEDVRPTLLELKIAAWPNPRWEILNFDFCVSLVNEIF